MAKAQPPQEVKSNPYPFWAARFWHGMSAGAWFGLLARNRFRIHPFRLPMAGTISPTTFLNSGLRPLQELILGSKLAKCQVKDAPIFIIGHWRSGTTLLHELMVLDQRYTYPTTYQCFAPNHFLITEWLITKLRFLLPQQRPMDNMLASWDRPQEEEFALMNMGVRSPYLTIAFPNEAPQDPDYFDLENLTPEQRKHWQDSLMWFLKRVSFLNPKRLILKSPPHLARIKAILEIFPDARFVHIVRDPYVLFASTIKLWKTMYQVQALQIAHNANLEEYVFDCFERMYRAFEAQRHLVDPARLYEVRYEELVGKPFDTIRDLYESLNLGGFDAVRPRLEQYLANTKDYKTNQYQIEPELRREIDRRWGPFMERYGYCRQSLEARESA